MLFGAKNRLIWRFLKISILLDFVTKLIFKTLKNPLKNTNKEASDRVAIQMENASKFWNRRIIQKNMFFHLLNALLVGVTKLEAFQWYKVTKLNPSKPSPLFD